MGTSWAAPLSALCAGTADAHIGPANLGEHSPGSDLLLCGAGRLPLRCAGETQPSRPHEKHLGMHQ